MVLKTSINNVEKIFERRYEFLAPLFSEYAVESLGIYDVDISLYYAIKKYFDGGEMKAQRLYEKFRENDDFTELFSFFPDNNDKTAWNQCFEEIVWECKDNENIWTLGDKSIKTRKLFLNLYYNNSRFYAQKYRKNGDKYEFSSLGSGEFSKEISNPYYFLNSANIPEESMLNVDELVIADDEFFGIAPMIKEADPDQRAAMSSGVDKHLVILAGAGSGKTRTLVCRLAYLHLVKKIKLNQIVLLTFSRNAANEMKKRSEELMMPIYSSIKPLDTPNVYAKTIDGFFRGLVDEFWMLMGFEQKPAFKLDDSKEVKQEKLKWLEEIIAENRMEGVFKYYYDIETQKPNKNFAYLLIDLENYAWGIQINHAGLGWLLQSFLQKQRENNTILGFVYVSLFVKEGVNKADSDLTKAISSRYQCILIDEFQDINILQNDIFTPLYNSGIHFTFVGDDDQSIYGWRGSDNLIIKNMMSKPNVIAKYLLTNYRNNPNIVEAGNAVLRTVSGRAKTDQQIKPFRKSGAKIKISTYDGKYTNIANEVSRLIDAGQNTEDICIMTRQKADADEIAKALSADSIPVAKEKVVTDKTNKDYRLMKAIFNIINENNVIAACRDIIERFEVKECTDRHIQKIVLGENDCESELYPVKILSDELRLNDIHTLAEATYRYSLKAGELFERVVNDRHSNPVFEAFECFCKNNEAPWPISKLQLEDIYKIFENETRNDYKYGGSLSNGVTISTIHKAKGLEYNVVMITGLVAGEYPNTNQIENEIRARNAKLSSLSTARSEYYTLKSTVIPETFNMMVNECSNSAFDSKESLKFNEFRNELISNKMEIMTLSADGIDTFISIYREYIYPVDLKYKEILSEIHTKKLVVTAKLEALTDEAILLEQEDKKAANSKKHEIKQFKEDVEKLQKKIDKFKDRELRFSKSIDTIKRFYKTCLNASGLLEDIEKCDEMQQLKMQIIEDGEKKKNEERRLFYVALTRAKDFLYLCYKEGTTPSEFIKLIPDAYKSDYTILTREQENEFNRLRSKLSAETQKVNIDEAVFDNTVSEIIENRVFSDYIARKITDFKAENLTYSGLPQAANKYLEQALGLLYIAELTGGSFKAEFAHNMQRVAEAVLYECSGAKALPFRTTDVEIAQSIADKIQRETKDCLTAPPSKKKLITLITADSGYSDEMKSLRSAGIMHYIVRSGLFDVDESITSTWPTKKLFFSPTSFIRAIIDLSNTRNQLIHPNKTPWPSDPIPVIINNVEVIIKACTKPSNTTVRTESENAFIPRPNAVQPHDLRLGLVVRHISAGNGRVTNLTDSSFSVDFGDGTTKIFLKNTCARYFMLSDKNP